jgi:hypothetical protein
MSMKRGKGFKYSSFQRSKLLNYFNIHSMDMKRYMLFIFSYYVKWVGERSEIVRVGRGRYE